MSETDEDRGEIAHEKPQDPATKLLVAQIETLSRLLPPIDQPPPCESADAEDDFFDNMPV